MATKQLAESILNRRDRHSEGVIREAMRILGQTKSEKKRIASINNGKKGGRKKQQLKEEGNS